MGEIRRKKLICYVLVSVLLFLGMSMEGKHADASFLRSQNQTVTSETTMRPGNYMEKENVCTLNMLSASNYVFRSNITGTLAKGQYRVILSFLIVGAFLQYLFYYQSAECKEDGQLFLCRTVVVDYIHLKDSGE